MGLIMMNVEEQTEVIRWSGDEIERLVAENIKMRGLIKESLNAGDPRNEFGLDLMGRMEAAVQTTEQTTEKDNWENEGGTV